ncbi:MAG: hypothetical protein SNJ82_10830 [Gemmataceae bacterium]
MLAVIAAAVGGHFFGQSFRPKSLPPALELVQPDSVLGELRTEEKQTRTLVLRNRLKEDVSVARFFGDCRCVSFQPASCTIPAEGQVEIVMEVVPSDPAGKNDRLELKIGVEAEASERGPFQVSWAMTGKLIREVEWEATQYTLGEVAESERDMVKGTLRFSANEPIESMEVHSSDEAFHASIVRDGQKGHLEIVPGKPREGLVHANLFVEVRLQGRTQPRKYRIGVQAYFLPEVELMPERLLSGIRDVGEMVEEEVCITSRSGEVLAVPRIENANPGVTVERLESTTGIEPRYRVRYRIEQPGYREQTLWFEVQRPGRPVQRLPLTVHTIGRETSPEQGAKP